MINWRCQIDLNIQSELKGNTGFLRHQEISTPNYEVPSEKTFREMLDPTYNRVKSALEELIGIHDPPVVSAVLDAWSQGGDSIDVENHGPVFGNVLGQTLVNA